MRIFYFNITYRCNSNCMFCAADHPLRCEDSEMYLSEFVDILEKNHVSTKDRVIVNGGEPTMHDDFFGFLDAICTRGAKIDLFSNGIRFSDKRFTQRVLAYKNIYIRIPLFGASAEMHDNLTGHPGGFDLVTRGLDNVCCELSASAELEIKLLLSKATVYENEAIYELVNTRWNNERVYLSLNPLLISECVAMRSELFIDTYETLMQASEPLIRRVFADKWKFSLDLIPYCTFPNRELIALCHSNAALEESFYADSKNQMVIDEMKGRERCLKCQYVRKCNGFPPNYVAYFGQEVMKPILPCVNR